MGTRAIYFMECEEKGEVKSVIIVTNNARSQWLTGIEDGDPNT